MLLIGIFWVILGIDLLISFWDELSQVENVIERILATAIIFVGTPFFFKSGLLIEILEDILPEGWDDDGFF